MGRLKPLIERWLNYPGNSRRILSELSGVPERRIYCILQGYDAQTKRGKRYLTSNVEQETADKLLIAMGMEEEWYLSLLDIYEADDE
jgi:hypothetical protein